MKSVNLDHLIISGLQHKELWEEKRYFNKDTALFPLIIKNEVYPFFDNSALNLGLKLDFVGNKIIAIEVNRGYFYHNIEHHLSTLSLTEALNAISRLNMDQPIFYQVALLLAVHNLYNNSDLAHAHDYGIAMEFARIGHHLHVIKNILYCLQLNSIADRAIKSERLLEQPITMFSQIFTTNTIQEISIRHLQPVINEAIVETEELKNTIIVNPKVFSALRGKAEIFLSFASALGLTGPYLRANRSPHDLRQKRPKHPLYESTPHVSITEGGDGWARLNLRLLEVQASLHWLKHTLFCAEPKKPLKPLLLEESKEKNLTSTFAEAEVEGPEGDIKVSIFMDSRNQSLHFRIRSPAYFIAQAIPHMLADNELNELPLLLFSLGINPQEIDK